MAKKPETPRTTKEAAMKVDRVRDDLLSLIGYFSKAVLKSTGESRFSLFGGLWGPFDPIAPTQARSSAEASFHLEEAYSQASGWQEARGRVAVRRDLSKHRAFDTERKQLSDTVSVWQKLMSAGLDAAQLRRVLTSLAYVREGFVRQRGADGLIDADQKSNWLHTMDELDAVLDRTAGQPADLIERASMAMFGDAWKNKFNFTHHNYDGAHVARIVLSRQVDERFTNEHVHSVVEASKEHQVSPPGLMGLLYVSYISGLINSDRGGERDDLAKEAKLRRLSSDKQSRFDYLNSLMLDHNERGRKLELLESLPALNAEEKAAKKQLQERQRVGAFVTAEEYDALSRLQTKMANPYANELCDTANGGKAVAMSEDEARLLRLSGIEYWHVPHQSSAWFAESRTGVMSDILANVGLGGMRKLTGLNGPETDPIFQFGTIRECVYSALKTYADIDKILSPEEYRYVQARLGTMNGSINLSLARVREWLRQDPTLKDNLLIQNIPFWDTPLKYPDRGDAENQWWHINRIRESDRLPEQQKFWQEHRFDGLSESEKEDYLRAVRIRNRVVEEIGRELRLDNRFVPDFQPVMRRHGAPSSSNGNHKS